MSTGTSTAPAVANLEAELTAIVADIKKNLGNPPYTGFEYFQILVEFGVQLEGLVAKYGGVEEQWAALVAAVHTAVPPLVAEMLPRARDLAVRFVINHHLLTTILDHLEHKRAKVVPPPPATTPGPDAAVSAAKATPTTPPKTA